MPLPDEQLAAAIRRALKKAQKAQELPAFDIPTDIPVERPKQEEMGDYATPVCMQLARYARMAPIKIAEALVKNLRPPEFVGAVEVAHPGFVNFRLSDVWLTSLVDAILSAPEAYGRLDLGAGQRIQVEYVSANPTGPLHVGSARNAALGDTLASVLEAAGYDVQREYYVNDAGSRVGAFGETLYARYAQALGREAQVPEEGYHGPYMVELGQRLADGHGPSFLDMPHEEAVQRLGELGLEIVVAQTRDDLAQMGIRYDEWFSEQSLYANGQFEQIMHKLRQGDHLYLHDGAVWFKATAFGAPKDEVVVRSNGTPGYFASDIAYHYNKFVERRFDRVIDVWGADHQGHVPRMHAMMKALGLDPERLTIILYQLVTLKRGGEVVRLSKRTGDIITLREVLDEVGADAMRYFLVSRSADSQMDFDIDLAKEQSDENPVYYIQYAHARIAAILRHAGDLHYAEGDVRLLTHPAELALLRRMARLPETVRLAALQLAPHHLAYYAYELATAFHAFYRDCRVVSSEPEDAAITKARLKLVSACQVVLARALGLMGMSAPETM
ncbi:MAG: arginine--tRNA ligase [Chloroflexi bacterium]|nr:arginine--tRNA ligase [Chloroflexota bacterium]